MSHFFSPPGGQNKAVVPRGPSPGEKAIGALPGAKADAAARAGGGISPDFLRGILETQVGSGDLGILQQIRSSLNSDQTQAP